MTYPEHVNRLCHTEPELAAQVGRFHGLEQVLAWMRERGLDLGGIDVIAQDEFSHDLLVPLGATGRSLVFGMT